jgi:methionyl-tRNA formyltransferase
MKVVIAGQKRFGRDVAQLVLERGWKVQAVSCPAAPSEDPDKLHIFALNQGLPVIPAGQLRADRIPAGCDLIIAAHCHDFLSRKTRHRARLGALGYHPSLLPLHRGRSAIEWAVRLRERITGGSVYWLNDTVDGGPIAAQEHVFIRSGDTPRELWARELAPLGLRLFERVFARLDAGEIPRTPQEAFLASWEPALSGVPPLHRPELEMLCQSAADYAASARA